MKTSLNTVQYVPRRLTWLLTAFALAGLSACGGGASSSGSGAAALPTAAAPATSVDTALAAPVTSDSDAVTIDDTPEAVAVATATAEVAAAPVASEIAATASAAVAVTDQGPSTTTTEVAPPTATSSVAVSAPAAEVSTTPVTTAAASVAAATLTESTTVTPAAATSTPVVVTSVAAAAPSASTATASTTTSSTKRTFVHPGIGWSRDDWDYYKANVTREPWKTAYAAMLNDSHVKLTYATHVVAVLDSDPKYTGYESDMTAIHFLTVVGNVSGNEAYFKKATEIANEWCTGHKSGMPFLNISSYITRFLGAADFLRVNYSGWTAEQTKTCQDYVTNLYWPAIKVGEGLSGAGALLKSANQATALLHTAMDVAVFTDDSEKFDMVVDAFLTNTNGGILNSLPTGQIGDSGRDQGHPLGQIFGLSSVAETAWKQGVDLYSANDNRLLKAQEYWARYNVTEAKDPAPFTEFGPSYGLYFSHGCCVQAPYLEPATLVYKAYVIRKGLTAPWTEQLMAKYAQTRISSTFYRTADSSKATAPATPWTEPVAKALTQASDLKTLDVGKVGGPGSTQFDNGTWTLKTKSLKVEGGYRFAYREMKTDGTFIARIVNISGEGGVADNIDASGGIQIRTQLDASSKAYLSLLTNEKGLRISAFWRQSTASLNKSFQDYDYDATATTPHFFPYWVKIVRRGNFINAYTAPDGKSWSNIGHARFDVEVPETIFVGLTATSGSTAVEGTVVFDNVSYGASDTNSLAPAPASLTATTTTGGVRLDWSASDAAVFYKVQRSLTADGPATVIAAEVGDTGFLDSTALPNTTYYYQVATASFGGLSPYSAKASVKTGL